MYTIENCPQIKDNFYLSSRNAGASRKLQGKIELMICFMKRKITDFSLSTQNQFFSALYEACEWLKAEAKRYGKNLIITHRYFTIDVPENTNPSDGYRLICSYFNCKNLSMDQLQKNCENVLDVDEAPFILVFDDEARSFAHMQFDQHNIVNEISVIFKRQYDKYSPSSIAHELLHQFGAPDYYYPKKITECAEIYMKDSIMGIGKNNVLDDLTAYLVGIKDTISINSYLFLKETMWMNKELHMQAVREAMSLTNGKNNTIQTTYTKKQPNFTPVHSTVSGIVSSIRISAGQIVKTSDILVTLTGGNDSVIRATVPGRIDRVSVKIGQIVKKGTMIAVISRV